jgi:hypothetical protein
MPLKPGLRKLLPSGRSLVWLIMVFTAAFLLSLKYNGGDGSEPTQDIQVIDLVGEPTCDPADRACYAMAAGTRVAMRFEGEARALQPFPIRVQVQLPDHGRAAAVEVDFIMVGMDMGRNRYALARGADGAWHGKVTLPVCSSGRTDWQAVVRVRSDSTEYVAHFPFNLGSR